MRPLRKRSQGENPKASVEVSARASPFARKRIYGDEVIGVVPLELPPQVFQTAAIRFGPPRRGRPVRQESCRARLQPWGTRGASVRRNSNGDGGTGGRSIWIQEDNVRADR